MQKSSIHDHEKMKDHKSVVTRWEAPHFPPTCSISIIGNVQNATKTNMKILSLVLRSYILSF